MPPSTAGMTRATLGAAGVSAAVAAVFYAGAALSGIDGALGAGEYGARPAAQVAYNPAALDTGLRTPPSESSYGAYDTYLRSDPNFVYGLFQARPDLGGSSASEFTGIYLDLDPANGNGSDLGFAIDSVVTGFVPGTPGSVPLPGVAVARSGDGQTLEFAIPASLLTGPIAGLAYAPNQAFPAAGSPDVVFYPSQGFSLPLASGSPVGAALPGIVSAAVTDVPEPASAVLVLAGLAGAGALRRRLALNEG